MKFCKDPLPWLLLGMNWCDLSDVEENKRYHQVENQKGINAVQRYCIQNQKGINAVQWCSIENQKGDIVIDFVVWTEIEALMVLAITIEYRYPSAEDQNGCQQYCHSELEECYRHRILNIIVS